MTPFLFSNSSTYDWHKCKRAFYLRYLYGKQGITGTYVEEDLLFGAVVHEAMPVVWTGAYTDAQRLHDRLAVQNTLLTDAQWESKVSPTGRAMKAQEWGRLYEAVILAFQRTLLPTLRNSYDMDSAEGDVARWLPEYGEGQVALIAKPDTLLRPKASNEFSLLPSNGLGYLEYKTVASPNYNWQETFKRNPQSWTGAMTVRAARGVDIDWFLVCGLVKGTETADDEMGTRRNHALVWAYRWVGESSGRASKVDATTIIAPDGSKWSWEGTTAKGWERTSTDAFPGGVAGWVEALPLQVVSQYTVLTEAITIDWALAEEWLENQEPMITAAMMWKERRQDGNATPLGEAALMRHYFPRELSQCHSHRGTCTFAKMCHNRIVADDPIGSGYYKGRVSHHPLEVLLCNGSEK